VRVWGCCRNRAGTILIVYSESIRYFYLSSYPMLFRICIFLLLLPALSARSQTFPAQTAHELMAHTGAGDTVYVVNFWATWCAPCVKELPVFDTLQRMYESRPVRIILVSLDFPEDYRERLPAFVARKKPLPRIVWLNETNANKFIPEIDDRWSGAIPATMIISRGEKTFMERTVTVPDLTAVIDASLK